MEITLPPLRDRPEDIAALTTHFVGRHVRPAGKEFVISPQAVLMLKTYSWPGNVRELEGALKAGIASSVSGNLVPEDFPPELRADFRRVEALDDLFLGLPSLEALEQHYLSFVLKAMGGNKAQAAAVMNVTRATLYRMVKRAGRGSRPARKNRRS